MVVSYELWVVGCELWGMGWNAVLSDEHWGMSQAAELELTPHNSKPITQNYKPTTHKK